MRALIVLVVLTPVSAPAAGTIEIAYASLERMIVSSVLTDGGRRYLRGGPNDTCAYAFVQEPRVSSVGERLNIRFLFAGRAGKDVAGRCVGAGDNFDVVVSGVPRCEGGDIFLDGVAFASEHELYQLFAPLIEAQLTRAMRVPLKRVLERRVRQLAPTAGRVSLDAVTVESIDLGESSLQLSADFDVTIQP